MDIHNYRVYALLAFHMTTILFRGDELTYKRHEEREGMSPYTPLNLSQPGQDSSSKKAQFQKARQ